MDLPIDERNKLIMENIKLVYKVVHKFYSKYDFNEYVNQGVISLIDAIEKFNPAKGVKFTTFAYVKLKNDLLDYSMRSNLVKNPTSRKVKNKIVFMHDKDDMVTYEIDDCEYDVSRLKDRLSDKELKAVEMLIDGYKIKEIMKKLKVKRQDILDIEKKVNDAD